MKQNKNNEGFLDINDTNALKGVALILLLCHHLLGYNEELFIDVHIGNLEYGIFNYIGRISVVCVALFVLLSGYGLSRQTELKGMMSMKQFYRHRLLKLLLNFWPIFILFVGIDYIVFGRTFSDVYQTHILYKFLADFFGLAYLSGFYGYNPTWWFLSCIIVLYIMYPFINRLKNEPILLMTLSLAIIFIPFTTGQGEMLIYLFSFVAGIVMAEKPICIHKQHIIWGG